MRLFDSVLRRVKNPKKPQQKFLCHVMRLMLMPPGRNSAYTLSVEQPSPAPHSGAEETRIDTSLAHIARVVTTQPLQTLAVPKRVSSVFGTWFARSASPRANSTRGSPARQATATPEKSFCSATAASSACGFAMARHATPRR